MNQWMKNTLCILLSLMCIFSCIGYAQLSDSLSISGSTQIEQAEPEGIYISKVSVISVNGISNHSADIVLPTNLKSSFTVTQANASIVFEITVTNKTDMTYWYLGREVARETDPQKLIGTTNGISITTRDGASSGSTSFDQYDWVPPRTERTFYATYIFGSKAQGNVTTMINFKFGFQMASVSDAFLKVLNDGVSEYGYHYLAGAFDQNYIENNGSLVIGNLGEHEEIFNNLFGPSISINVNGENLPVTIMVERRDVDGKSATGDAYSTGNKTGCEYTVYITVDDLENKSGKATVYAVSYTRGADGVWYIIGDLYEGTADIQTYPNSDEASFNVSSWRAVKKEYTVVGNVSYKVGFPPGETDDTYTEIDKLMSIFHQTLYNNINNNVNTLLTTICHTIYSFKPDGNRDKYDNPNNLANPGYEELKRAFSRLEPYLILDNGASNVRLSDKSKNLSRAEIVRMLQDIQSAYEYYLAVNAK